MSKIKEEYTQIQKIWNKLQAESKKRDKKVIKKAKEWFEITCPHCNTTYTCTHLGNSFHCYTYITKDGIHIDGILETGILYCPNCNKEFKDKR